MSFDIKPCSTIPKECVLWWLEQECIDCLCPRYDSLIMLGWLFFGWFLRKEGKS